MIGLKEYSRNSNKGKRQLLMFLVSNNNPLQAWNVALKSFLACSGRTAAVLSLDSQQLVGWTPTVTNLHAKKRYYNVYKNFSNHFCLINLFLSQYNSQLIIDVLTLTHTLAKYADLVFCNCGLLCKQCAVFDTENTVFLLNIHKIDLAVFKMYWN